jgi:di/tricarboxylate transporter
LANTLIPVEERSLTPQQVEALDRRRRRGQLFLVLCFQCLIVATLVTLWSGQDLTYSPGWVRPMFYWNAILFLLAILFGIAGVRLRRGSNEFLSY